MKPNAIAAPVFQHCCNWAPGRDRAGRSPSGIRADTLARMERHFTVSGFVVDGDRTALHWHKRLGLWLPPGGHIERDEDPVEAVLREVLEETGIPCEVVPHQMPYVFTNVGQLPPPLSIIVADVADGPHQHIDLAYAVRPIAGAARIDPEEDHGFIWVNEAELRAGRSPQVEACASGPLAGDVRVVALEAIRIVRSASGRLA